MAGLALKGVMYGVDKVPDSWFDKVPGGYFRTKEDRDNARKDAKKQERRTSRKSKPDHEYDDDDDDEPYYSDDYDSRRGRHGDLGDRVNDGLSERNYQGRVRGKSQGAAGGYPGERYDGPPMGKGYEPSRPYHPADYAGLGMDARQHYYDCREQGLDGARYAAPAVVAGAAAVHYRDPSGRPKSTSGPVPGYVPYAHLYENEPQSPRTTKLQRDAERHPHDDDSRHGSDKTRYPPRGPYVESVTDSYHSHHSRGSDGSGSRHHGERDSLRSHHHKSRPRARSTYGDGYESDVGRDGARPPSGTDSREDRHRHRRDGHRSSKHHDRHDDGHRRSKHRSRHSNYYSD